jgi:hypothetical protein
MTLEEYLSSKYYEAQNEIRNLMIDHMNKTYHKYDNYTELMDSMRMSFSITYDDIRIFLDDNIGEVDTDNIIRYFSIKELLEL